MRAIDGYFDEFFKDFTIDKSRVLEGKFIVITANTKNPYRQLYTHH